MKYLFTAIFFIASLDGAPVQASPLNTQSNLVDEGIDPAPLTPMIMDDIPLMPGLQKVADKDVLYVTPPPEDVIKVVTVGIVDVDDVYNFYKRRLPAMGWIPAGARDYTKGKLILHIDAHAVGKRTTVTFSEDITTP